MYKSLKGQTLIEVLVSATLVVLILVLLVSLVSNVLEIQKKSANYQKAQELAQESLEAVSAVTASWTDQEWTSPYYSGIFYPATTGSKWSLIKGVESNIMGKFTRQIKISTAYRDNSSRLLDYGSVAGTPDLYSKWVESQVFWQERGKDFEMSAILLITKWKD